ncbi:MAG: lipoyl(octanoyl) transferase LipB [Ferruginibacter sp.]
MDKQKVIFKDLGIIEYKTAWDYQESLLQENVKIKSAIRNSLTPDSGLRTQNYFLLCEHPPVYTLGKSGKKEHVLMSDDELAANDIAFFNTNRGGDITFHGLQQIVGYPILDLEKYYTDIGKYLRNLEEMIILTIADYGINGGRSKGETGVWIDADIPGRERKICAIGVRCSRWITMHGFAMNVNTDLGYFNNIIPCGIENKQVTSIEKELGHKVDYAEVKEKVKSNFEKVFVSDLIS